MYQVLVCTSTKVVKFVVNTCPCSINYLCSTCFYVSCKTCMNFNILCQHFSYGICLESPAQGPGMYISSEILGAADAYSLRIPNCTALTIIPLCSCFWLFCFFSVFHGKFLMFHFLVMTDSSF